MIQCPNRPICDGCPNFELDDDDDHARVLEELRPLFETHDLEVPTEILGAGPRLGYRNRAKMVVKRGQLGFYSRGSRDFVPIETCLVHDQNVEAAINAIRPLVKGLDGLKFIDVRYLREGVVTLSGKRDFSSEETEPFRVALSELPTKWSLHQVVSSASVVHPSNSSAPVLEARVRDESFELPADAFFQLNTYVLEAIHEAIRERVESGDLLDLYCGIGTHGLSLVSPEGRVRGFDAVESSVLAARRNAEALKLEADFAIHDDSQPPNWSDVAGSTAITNPGRQGMSTEVVEWLNSKDLAGIVYVSCQPETFTRDVERLTNWKVDEIQIWDMLPKTSRVEVLAFLSPRKIEVLEPSDTWVALVAGRAPHGELPGGKFKVRAIKRTDQFSLVSIQGTPVSEDEIVFALRKWGFPLLTPNQALAKSMFLNRLPLENVVSGAPCHLFAQARVPVKILDSLVALGTSEG